MQNEYSELMVPWHQNAHEVVEVDTSLNKSTAAQPYPISRSLVESAYRTMLHDLNEKLISYIYAQDYSFFEKLVVDVVSALGYGGRRRDLARCLGRSGDGGIDGVVSLDELGLDAIYLQAKRLKPGSQVAVSAVRDFVGSLEAKRATKGIFVTTGSFTHAAKDVVANISKKVVLINGARLTELMVRHNIGVKAKETLQFKELDMTYFAVLGKKAT